MTFVLPPISSEEAERLCLSPEYESMRISIAWHPWTLYLNIDQRYLGRAYAWLESRHVDLHPYGELTLHERCILAELTRAYEKTTRALWGQTMLNCAWLGNEVKIHRGHGHLHFIPRYASPPSWNGRSFPDPQFGSNYAPYKKLRLKDSELQVLRATIEDELRKHV